MVEKPSWCGHCATFCLFGCLSPLPPVPRSQLVDSSEISRGQQTLNLRSPACPFIPIHTHSSAVKLQPWDACTNHRSTLSRLSSATLGLACPLSTSHCFAHSSLTSKQIQASTSTVHHLPRFQLYIISASLLFAFCTKLLPNSLTHSRCAQAVVQLHHLRYLPSFVLPLNTQPIPHLALFFIHYPSHRDQPQLTKTSSCADSPPSRQQTAPFN